MITKRINARRTVEVWLNEVIATAKAEKAEITQDKLETLREPLMYMTASSEAADPEEMEKILTGRYEEKVVKYLQKNWSLVGLKGSEKTCPEATARIAISGLSKVAGEFSDGSAKGIISLTERAAMYASSFDEIPEASEEAVSILLREALGLPGDAAHAGLITDNAVLRNALDGLSQLGVAVQPDAYPVNEDAHEVIGMSL